MGKKYTKKHVFILLIVIVVFCIGLYSALVLRDYDISFTGGPHLVAEIPVPGAPSFTVNNTVPGKLSVSMRSVPGADGYEVQISRFSGMWFSKSYRSVMTQKDLGMLSGGTTYYLRARVYKKNDAGRMVNGQWGAVKSALCKE